MGIKRLVLNILPELFENAEFAATDARNALQAIDDINEYLLIVEDNIDQFYAQGKIGANQAETLRVNVDELRGLLGRDGTARNYVYAAKRRINTLLDYLLALDEGLEDLDR